MTGPFQKEPRILLHPSISTSVMPAPSATFNANSSVIKSSGKWASVLRTGPTPYFLAMAATCPFVRLCPFSPLSRRRRNFASPERTLFGNKPGMRQNIHACLYRGDVRAFHDRFHDGFAVAHYKSQAETASFFTQRLYLGKRNVSDLDSGRHFHARVPGKS